MVGFCLAFRFRRSLLLYAQMVATPHSFALSVVFNGRHRTPAQEFRHRVNGKVNNKNNDTSE